MNRVTALESRTPHQPEKLTGQAGEVEDDGAEVIRLESVSLEGGGKREDWAPPPVPTPGKEGNFLLEQILDIDSTQAIQ
jgi:hypothetical protein